MAGDEGARTTPVTIIGGYLGAGKTTLVNHLLRSAEGMRLAVLVNEFGALPIDADLIEGQDGNVLSIAGGCVCCSYGNDLVLTLQELAAGKGAFDHVLVEASGVAIPSAIAATVSLIPGYALDCIVILADAETIQSAAADRYVGDTVSAQLRDGDLIILNKIDLVDEPSLAGLGHWFGEMHEDVRLFMVSRAQIPRALVLGGLLYPDRQLAAPADASHSDEAWRAETIDVPGACDPEAFARSLVAAGFGRAKGFVADPAGELWTIQVVGQRVEVSRAPAGATPGVVGIRLRIA